MEYLIEHKEILYLLLALSVCILLFLLLIGITLRRRRSHHIKVRMGVNPINAKPHPSGFIPKDKQMSREHFVTKYEGIPSSIYQSNPKKKNRY